MPTLLIYLFVSISNWYASKSTYTKFGVENQLKEELCREEVKKKKKPNSNRKLNIPSILFFL